MSKLATFSFDDGGPADFEVIDLFDAEGVVPTMYLISGLINSDEMIYGRSSRQLAAVYTKAEVGSHTVSHPHLSLASDEETRYELGVSKAVLETRLERPVTLFAHPYGSSGGRTEDLLEECGYQWARRIWRSGGMPSSHRFRMPIDVMLHGQPAGLREEQETLDELISDGANIHVLCHSWWLFRENKMDLLASWLYRLLNTGYEVVPNSQYFKHTLQPQLP